MPAPTGNKNAERWTRERTIQYLDRIEEYMQLSDALFLGDALQYVGLYNDIWSYWKEKWQDDEEIYDRIMLIMQGFQNRIFNAALFKKVHAGMAMFVLKCHYGWALPKAEKEKPVAAPMHSTPAPTPQVPVVEKETIKEKIVADKPASLPSEKAETSSLTSNDTSTEVSYHIDQHNDVPLPDTGS